MKKYNRALVTGAILLGVGVNALGTPPKPGCYPEGEGQGYYYNFGFLAGEDFDKEKYRYPTLEKCQQAAESLNESLN